MPPGSASRSAPARLVAALATSVLVGALTATTALWSAPSAHADPAVAPFTSTLRITGAGWGHGIGMSQYGAGGAAAGGRTWQQIIAFYYPGTTVKPLPTGNKIRVWITADSDGSLTVLPASGLRLRDLATGDVWTMPTGSGYTQWRISRSGSSSVLAYRTTAGAWKAAKPTLAATARWQVENTATGTVKVVLPGSSVRTLRGQVNLTPYGSGARTVNRLLMEDYVRGVVPAEMPTSWAAHAVRAQAVAARSYAGRLRESATSSGYDLCDTTACQVYGGVASETANGDAAVKATANQVVMAGSSVALTQFSSSNGGYTVRGSAPYLAAKADPYDAMVRNQTWTTSFTTSEVQRHWPSVGTLRSVQVLTRDGGGRWGGRVESVRLVGSSATVTVSGSSFRSTLGLRSSLFSVTGGLAPAGALYAKWQQFGGSIGWVGAPSTSERVLAGGQEARFDGADLLWSQGTGAHAVNGRIRTLYRSLGSATFITGFPTTDETAGPVAGSRQSLFTNGGIYYSRATGAQVMYGSIHRFYAGSAPARTRLGLPLGAERAGSVAGVRVSDTQHGAIYWTAALGAHEVSGAPYPVYRKLGADGSKLGLPTATMMITGNGSSVTFEHGTIACATGRECVVTYR